MSPNRTRMAVAIATVTAVGLGIVGNPGPGFAAAGRSTAAPAVTRAALPPSLVAGRGADVPFVEQVAERAETNGTVIGPDRTVYTLPAEATGRSAVKLAPGQCVEFTLPRPANAINVRYSIPDAPHGGGITAPLDVTVYGKWRKTVTLTSEYAYLYVTIEGAGS